MPAPKGKGLCIEKECQKILGMAGIKDVWSKTKGHTEVKTNLVMACFDALKQLSSIRVQQRYYKNLSIVDGAIKKQEPKEDIVDGVIKKQEPKEDIVDGAIKKQEPKEEIKKASTKKQANEKTKAKEEDKK